MSNATSTITAPKAEVKAKAEAPKVEPPKAEAPKVEPPKAEAPKVEPPKAEAPKVDAEAEVKPPEVAQAEELEAKAKVRAAEAAKAEAAAEVANKALAKAEGPARVKAEVKAEDTAKDAKQKRRDAEMAGILSEMSRGQAAVASFTRLTSKDLWGKGKRVWQFFKAEDPDIKASAIVDALEKEAIWLRLTLDTKFVRRCLNAELEHKRANKLGKYAEWSVCTDDKKAKALLDEAEGKAAKARKVQTAVQRHASAVNTLETLADIKAARLALDAREEVIKKAEEAAAKAQAKAEASKVAA